MGCAASAPNATSTTPPAPANDARHDAMAMPATPAITLPQTHESATKVIAEAAPPSSEMLLALAMDAKPAASSRSSEAERRTLRSPLVESGNLQGQQQQQSHHHHRPARVVVDFPEDEHASHGLPDVNYSMRRKPQDDALAVSPVGPAASTSSGLSRNVIVNRPAMAMMMQSGPEADAQQQHPQQQQQQQHLAMVHPFAAPGMTFLPLQQRPPFVNMDSSNQLPPRMMLAPMPMHAAAGPFAPHGIHLAPLDSTGHAAATGDPAILGAAPWGAGRGRGVPPAVAPMPMMMAPGFRGPVLVGVGRGPVAFGSPQAMYPPRRTSQEPVNPTKPVVSAGEKENPVQRHKEKEEEDVEDDDDDDDNLTEDGEEVEDWGLDDAPEPEKKTVVADAHGPTRPPPPTPTSKPQPTDQRSTATSDVRGMRPKTFDFEGDGIQTVDSDGSEDDDDDDDDGVAWGDEGTGDVHDWLDDDDTNAGKGMTPLKSGASSLGSHGNLQPLPTGSSRSHAGSQFAVGIGASQRQLNGVPIGGGQVSPTRPAGPPPVQPAGGSSQTKPLSYRSNIVTNATPLIMPLSNGAGGANVASPASTVTPTALNGGIREVKVVKKKKAELPQHNLPHPAPKFGDWLNQRTMINNYIILETLGTGGYAEVKLCKEKVTGKLFAMKFINRDLMKKDKLGKQSKLDDIKREIAIMKKLNHPNVLRLYEVMDDPNMNKLFLVLEYMKHGDLLGHLKKKRERNAASSANDQLQMHDRDLHCVFLQVILGVAYLHEQKIVHGDIKPQNLLVGDKDVVKIADFGISQSLYGSKQKLNDTAGTPAFMSPEMCSGQEYSGQLADIWAVGATMFMLKFGHPPFVANSAWQLFEKIQNDPLVFPGPLDPLLEDLLRGMLTKNPLKRMTMLQIMTHPWVTKEDHATSTVVAREAPVAPITVTKEEIENAIGSRDRFAIIVNIRIQMMKRLQRARQQLLERRQRSGLGADAEQLMLPGPDVLTKPFAKTNKVFVENDDANAATARPERMLSMEETQYRTQLFTRKKPSAASPAALTAVPGDHSSNTTVAKSETATDSDGVDAVFSDDEDEEDDDDGDHAVAQSPQLLEELLMTTLSMPPLSNAKSPNAVRLSEASCSGSERVHSDTPSVIHTAAAKKTHDLPASQPHEANDSQSFHVVQPALRVAIAVASLQGRRSTQEDRWTVLPSISSASSSRCAGSAFLGLYDGHGGEECANILQEQLHPWLFRATNDVFASPAKMQRRFLDFDTFVCDYLSHKGDLSGSTATCVFIDETKSRPERSQWRLLVAHVGDCRAVLGHHDGRSVEVTQDHRLTVPAERDRVVQLGGRVVNNRVNGVMAITRAFGDLEFKGLLSKSVETLQFHDEERLPALLTARPDVHEVCVDGTNVEFLLIACDGLWDVMSSEEATTILRDRVHLHGDLRLAARELAQEAIRRYSNDNITVIVVQFSAPA